MGAGLRADTRYRDLHLSKHRAQSAVHSRAMMPDRTAAQAGWAAVTKAAGMKKAP
jgi:hypothetical protein